MGEPARVSIEQDIATLREAVESAVERQRWLGYRVCKQRADRWESALSRVESELERLREGLRGLERALEDTRRALEWALDVLEISLARIDTVDGPLSDEHMRMRAVGLAKAHRALAAAGSPTEDTPGVSTPIDVLRKCVNGEAFGFERHRDALAQVEALVEAAREVLDGHESRDNPMNFIASSADADDLRVALAPFLEENHESEIGT